MEALPRDILGQIAAKPSLARPLSFTCRAICDAMRGLFILDLVSDENGTHYRLSGLYFESIIISISDAGIYVVGRGPRVEIIKAFNYYQLIGDGPARNIDPVNIRFFEYYGEIYVALLKDETTLLEFIGILFTHVYKPIGFYDNFYGASTFELEYSGTGEYYYTTHGIEVNQTRIDPATARGGVTKLCLTHSDRFCTVVPQN